ncbi:prohormone convertase 1 [Elysia marginata]|uniref:Prohormone convertase 1 n=1 Tax=Elysia marginata TaxID=1093978 RepID=A0AAV4JXD6_9GAST|nr:prohormone convertase 1 [Elysia marginata]
MRQLTAAAVVLLAIVLSEYGVHSKHFVNEWAAEIRGGRSVAEAVAEHHGYIVVDELRGLPDHYILKRSDVPHRSKRSAHHHTRRLEDDTRVSFVEQQHEKVRVKRGYLPINARDTSTERWSRDVAREIVKKDARLDDPSFNHEWYINPGETNKRDFELAADLRVKEVWKKGITGKNVVLTILDDGVEKNNTDIAPNYDPNASYDINDNDTDPHPRYDPTNENKHGTRCAGEIVMVANNQICGVGVAFDSKVGGIRLLDGRVTDSTEAFSLSYNRQHIDIYSASWGPNDDGKTTEQPGKLVQKALKMGVEKGRGGKGSIFAWASGNGGRVGDNCNSDGYTSSIYTLSVSSATQYGNSPWYAERCSSSMAATYSSGAMNEGKVVTVDLHNTCTEQHSGTSAAAPLAAGIVALLLEANPELTWRDVQHITVHTARMEPLKSDQGWYRNAAGYCVNLAFGFGLMDALAMVEMADPATWVSVGEQHVCNVELKDKSNMPRNLTSGNFIEVEFTTDGCHGQASEINFLEHIEVILSLSYERRGVIYAEIESPSGTITSLMQERHYDASRKGFKDFPLMSVHTWGEDPVGTWKFRVADKSSNSYSGELENVKLVLYGTKEKSDYRQRHPKNCQEVNTKVDPTRSPTPVSITPLWVY